MDKMSDREKDLRILCEQVTDDFLKNQDITNPPEKG